MYILKGLSCEGGRVLGEGALVYIFLISKWSFENLKGLDFTQQISSYWFPVLKIRKRDLNSNQKSKKKPGSWVRIRRKKRSI